MRGHPKKNYKKKYTKDHATQNTAAHLSPTTDLPRTKGHGEKLDTTERTHN